MSVGRLRVLRDSGSLYMKKLASASDIATLSTSNMPGVSRHRQDHHISRVAIPTFSLERMRRRVCNLYKKKL